MPSYLNKTVSSEVSSIIRFIRFPLIFGVVLMHTHLPLDNRLPTIINEVLQPIIPTFFLISSYLFFFSFDGWNWELFYVKLHRRFYSLFIPYLVWNALAILLFYLVHRLSPGMISHDFQDVSQFTAIDFLKAFWDGTDGNPISYQLWFLRDLMVLSIFAPLFYFLLRYRLCWIFFAVLLTNELFRFVDVRAAHSIAWFGFGSLFAINKVDVLKYLNDSRYSTIVLYLLFFAVSFFFNAFLPVSHFLGVFAALDLARIMVKKGLRIPELLTEVAFFVYLFHGCTIMIITKTISLVLHNHQFLLTIGYFMSPVLMTIVCIIIYSCLKRLFPSFTNILVGKRMKTI